MCPGPATRQLSVPRWMPSEAWKEQSAHRQDFRDSLHRAPAAAFLRHSRGVGGSLLCLSLLRHVDNAVGNRYPPSAFAQGEVGGGEERLPARGLPRKRPRQDANSVSYFPSTSVYTFQIRVCLFMFPVVFQKMTLTALQVCIQEHDFCTIYIESSMALSSPQGTPL